MVVRVDWMQDSNSRKQHRLVTSRHRPIRLWVQVAQCPHTPLSVPPFTCSPSQFPSALAVKYIKFDNCLGNLGRNHLILKNAHCSTII